MKNRIVIWGENTNAEKVLLALELLEKENKVQIYVFPHEKASEEFYNTMMSDWKEFKDVEFPDGFETLERSLSMTESILPDDLKTDKGDILTRAQAEWHFTVLSSKLFEMYNSELDEFKEKVDALSEYSEEAWNEMKSFWSKVQDQVRERNIFRDQASTLKERTNIIFDKLKTLRKQMKKELEEKSSEIKSSIEKEIAEIESKIEQGLALNPIFQELKELQNKFFKKDLTRKDKNDLWAKIDSLFKEIKDKKYGSQQKSKSGGSSRLKNRYDGLLKAIQRMEKSISYDKNDINFQNTKISTTDGQLEMQIRQAKLAMIEERLNSKQSKLQDMYNTKKELEAKLSEEAKKKELEKVKQEKEEIKKEIKEKIISEIQEKKEALMDKKEELIEAAKEIQDSKKPKAKTKDEPKANTIADKIEDIVEDISSSVKAVGKAIEEKLDDLLDSEEE